MPLIVWAGWTNLPMSNWISEKVAAGAAEMRLGAHVRASILAKVVAVAPAIPSLSKLRRLTGSLEILTISSTETLGTRDCERENRVHFIEEYSPSSDENLTAC